MGYDLHDVIVRLRKCPNGLRMYPMGYAGTHRVTQPIIFLCHFQIIQQHMIRAKYLSFEFCFNMIYALFGELESNQ